MTRMKKIRQNPIRIAGIAKINVTLFNVGLKTSRVIVVFLPVSPIKTQCLFKRERGISQLYYFFCFSHSPNISQQL